MTVTYCSTEAWVLALGEQRPSHSRVLRITVSERWAVKGIFKSRIKMDILTPPALCLGVSLIPYL